MASIQKRKNGDGSISFLAQVRIKPFKPVAKCKPTYALAKKWAADLEAELVKRRDEGETRAVLTSLSIKGLVDEFLADPEVQQLKYRPDLEALLAWWVNHCGGDKALSFGAVKLREARDLLRRGRAPATVNRYLSALRSAWNWARAAGLVPQEKAWPTRLFLSEPRERVRFLNDTELAAVLTVAEAHSPWIHAAVVVSLATGLRQGELLRLQWKDVDFEKKTVTVLISKNTKRRSVHLPDPAIAALMKMRRDGVVSLTSIFTDERGEPADKGYLNFRWRKVRTAAGLVDFRWHDLRHSCASFLAQNGASLVEVGAVLGHSSPSITAKYAHLIAGKAVTGADKLAEKLRGA
ncbi:MAG TPA: site-specific integrase [Steroidobacteraceae bacterium]